MIVNRHPPARLCSASFIISPAAIPQLPPSAALTVSAASRTGALARWMYFSVISGLRWPRSLPISQYGLVLPESQTGHPVAQVVKMHVLKLRLGADPKPDIVQPCDASGAVAPRCREHAPAFAPEAVENAVRRSGQPHGPGSRLAAQQEQVAVPVIGPLQGQYLTLAAAGEQ